MLNFLDYKDDILKSLNRYEITALKDGIDDSRWSIVDLTKSKIKLSILSSNSELYVAIKTTSKSDKPFIMVLEDDIVGAFELTDDKCFRYTKDLLACLNKMADFIIRDLL